MDIMGYVDEGDLPKMHFILIKRLLMGVVSIQRNFLISSVGRSQKFHPPNESEAEVRSAIDEIERIGQRWETQRLINDNDRDKQPFLTIRGGARWGIWHNAAWADPISIGA